MGSKKALVAIGRKLLVIAYHLLKNKTTYNELGAQFVDDRKREGRVKYFTRELEKLGHSVTPKAA